MRSVKFKTHDRVAEAYEGYGPTNKKQYWLRLHLVRGFKTEVRISRQMFETIIAWEDYGDGKTD